MKVLSLGWGVQTWTLAAMMAKGAIPKADVAIHADTTFEREATYGFASKWTDWLREHGLPVVTVQPKRPQVSRLLADAGTTVTKGPRKGQVRSAPEYEVKIPAFNTNGGRIPRQCTQDWKIDPIRRELRQQLRASGENTAVMQIGISKDEWTRAKDPDVGYIRNEFPLLNDTPMTRDDCVNWLKDEKLPVAPKSSCAFCPFHKQRFWEAIRAENGPDQRLSLKVDEQIRDCGRNGAKVYLLDSLRPLADLRIPEDYGLHQGELFDEEFGENSQCDEGVCWV